LRITLVRNARHFSSVLVVTSPEDEATQELAGSVSGVEVFVTDAFIRHGARFNKGLAFEEAFAHMGRSGWICIWDADILLPDEMPLDRLSTDYIYGARRRVLHNVAEWSPQYDWRKARIVSDAGPIGYFQLFHADAPALRDQPYWYDPTFAYAGGGDAYFLNLFPRDKRRMLPMHVLHLGECNRHWFGTDEESKRIMDAFIIRNGWTKCRRHIDREQAATVGEIKERVEIPGMGISSYELEFVRQARERRARGVGA